MPTSFRNGLYVSEDAVDFNAVDKALYEVDDHLFLTWEVTDGAKAYRVLYDRGDHEPAEICRWVNERGDPLPLSSGLVERVKSLRPRDGVVDLDASRKANEELERRQVADFEAEVDEIVKDMGPRAEGRKRPVLHRGQHLRLARQRTGHHRKDQTQ